MSIFIETASLTWYVNNLVSGKQYMYEREDACHQGTRKQIVNESVSFAFAQQLYNEGRLAKQRCTCYCAEKWKYLDA